MLTQSFSSAAGPRLHEARLSLSAVLSSLSTLVKGEAYLVRIPHPVLQRATNNILRTTRENDGLSILTAQRSLSGAC